MTKKYYFDASEQDPEQCYTLEHFRQELEYSGVDELTLIEAKPSYGSGYFWCKEFHEIGEVGEACGKQCHEYKPRNGKNGRCRHSHHLYEPGEKKIVVRRLTANQE